MTATINSAVTDLLTEEQIEKLVSVGIDVSTNEIVDRIVAAGVSTLVQRQKALADGKLMRRLLAEHKAAQKS